MWFWTAQAIMAVLAVIGWFVLIFPCLLEAWDPSPNPSINDGRKIDRWSWRILAPWDNPEDGVSGQQALVWINPATRGPFMPGGWAPWRAWVWSAWRNSTNALKYTLALGWHGPRMKPRQILGRTLTGGWSVENGVPVLVLSFKS